jgi:hypothetical protein
MVMRKFLTLPTFDWHFLNSVILRNIKGVACAAKIMKAHEGNTVN